MRGKRNIKIERGKERGNENGNENIYKQIQARLGGVLY